MQILYRIEPKVIVSWRKFTIHILSLWKRIVAPLVKLPRDELTVYIRETTKKIK